MVKRHLKRLVAKRTWPIKRKGIKFITRPMPGMHTFDAGLPINVFLRDMLKVAKTNREVKRIIFDEGLMVDGKKIKDTRFIVGLMDTVSILRTKEHYRVIFNQKGKLDFLKISEKEANTKLCKISGKTNVKGKTQLNLSDGRNLLVEKDDYKCGDVLVLEVPSQKIKDKIVLEKGNLVYITSGKHLGEIHHVEDIIGKKITLKTATGDVFETVREYAFVVGKEKPVVSLK